MCVDDILKFMDLHYPSLCICIKLSSAKYLHYASFSFLHIFYFSTIYIFVFYVDLRQMEHSWILFYNHSNNLSAGTFSLFIFNVASDLFELKSIIWAYYWFYLFYVLLSFSLLPPCWLFYAIPFSSPVVSLCTLFIFF